MKYEYGKEYETNGEKPNLPDDVLVVFKNTRGNQGKCRAEDVYWHNCKSFRIVDERWKPNDWHERGELPPIGTFCEVNTNRHGNSPMWGRCKFLGVEDGYVFWLEWNSDKIPCPCREDLDKVVGIFRPIQSERDVLVEKLSKAINDSDRDVYTNLSTRLVGVLANYLIENNWRPVKQQTEDEFVSYIEKSEPYFYPIDEECAKRLYRAGCRFVEV